MWDTNGGLILGYKADRVEGDPPSLHPRNVARYTGAANVITTGPTGSGKSRRSLLNNICTLTDWSKVIVDSKGELYSMTAEHLRRAGNDIIVLDPFGKFSHGHNPIQALELNDEFPDDALGLAEAIVRIEGKEPHFSQAAQEWGTGLLMYIRLMFPGWGSFEDFRALAALDDERIRELVLSDSFEYKGNHYLGMVQAGIKHDWEEIGIKAQRFGDINPENRELHSVLSTLLTQTRWGDSRPIKKDLKGPPHDFLKLKQKPTTVYLILPARRIVTHSTWLRMMISSIIQPLMKDTRRSKVPVLLLLDEFPALAGGGYGSADTGDGFPIVSANQAMFRGHGIKLWTVWQDIAQARRIFGEGFESFFANAGVVQSFAPSHDLITAKYLSELTGQTTRQVLSQGRSRQAQPGAPGGIAITDNANLGVIPAPLMLPQDIRNMDRGFTVSFVDTMKGTQRFFLPDPRELPHLRAVCALDPSA